MKVTIKETGTVENLTYIDQNGIDITSDFVGNYDAFNNGTFAYDDCQDAYDCSQSDFDWWNKVINDQMELDAGMAELVAEHGWDVVYDAIGDAGNVDLEDMAASITNALDAFFK